MNERRKGVDTIRGVAAVGAPIVGVISLIAAFFPLAAGDFLGASVFMIASAVAFGSLSVAVLGRI